MAGDKRIGYARVSTDDQHLDLQLDALQRAGVAGERIYSDRASGKNAERKELAACLKALRQDDTLVVWRLDRLGRSLPDLVRMALGKRSVILISHRSIGLDFMDQIVGL